MVSTAGTAVSVFPEWRFPNAGLRGHGGRNIHLIALGLMNRECVYFFCALKM